MGYEVNSGGTQMTIIITVSRVVFNLNGGHIGGNPANIIHSVPYLSTVGSATQIPLPRNTAHTFIGWRLEGAGPILSAARVAEHIVDRALTTFVAIWEPGESERGDGAGGSTGGGIGNNNAGSAGSGANGSEPGADIPHVNYNPPTGR